MSSLASCLCRQAARSLRPAAPSTAVKAVTASFAAPRRNASTVIGRSRPSARPSVQQYARNGRQQQVRTMFVQTETTPNEDALKFIPGVKLSESGQTHEFLSSQDARISPLATTLFEIPGVRLVFFGSDFLTVGKTEDSQWSLMKPEIYSTIIEFFSQGKPLFHDAQSDQGPEDTRILDTDSEVVAMIKELLDTRVRPSIMEDGGDLEYKGFDEDSGVVRISLKGSCRGCDSSTVTLKNGVERLLAHYIPEVKSVEQIVSAEEVVAADEFAKFEARLRSEGKTVEI